MDERIIAAAGGALVVAVGAWLNALLTNRRERWNLRRELYSRLLEHLGEAVDALELLYDNVLSGPGRDEELEKAWDARINKLTERESQAEEEIRRATSVAAIMLNDEAIEALKSLHKEWKLSGPADTWDEEVGIRLSAAKKAYSVLVAAAKKDLFHFDS